ncbi:MAG: nickel pincer cofactor biosynthesis protein LarC [Lentisphaeraceae bacterium]|nr:nickel pincer cofactor biosynthesis protein LarC [Lentisphaeraceae bacterium]
MKTLFIDPFTGIAGDMFTGALLNLDQIDTDAFFETLNSLNLEGCSASTEKILKNGIRANKFNVMTPEGMEGPGGEFSGKTKKFIPLTKISKTPLVKQHDHDHDHRSLQEVLDIIKKSKLAENVKNLSCEIFTELGKAEAYIHDKTLESVHFHEVGAADAIYDICAAALALTMLKIDKVVCRPVAVGSGTVKTAHGILPVPAPATARLLEGIPTLAGPAERELTTPTGAAILKTICSEYSANASGTLTATGYGAGTLTFKTHANVLKASLLEDNSSSKLETDTVVAVICNIDDMPGEILTSLIPDLLELGALDVTCTPCMMKKGRQGFQLEVLCPPELQNKVSEFLLVNTSTFGVRFTEYSRQKLKREFIELETEYGKITVKAGYMGEELIKISPEYENCKALSDQLNVPVTQIYSAVQASALPLLKKN